MSERSSGYWAKVMGTFWRHPRTSGISLAARGLWVSLLSWCADQRTDGAVPVHVVAMVCGGRADTRALAELEASELVIRSGTGLELRNWSKHNITRDKHEKEKERARNGMRDKRTRSPSVTRNKPVSDGPVSEQEQEQEHSRSTEREIRARAPDPVEVAPRVREALTEAQRAEAVRAYLGPAWRERTGATPPELSALTPRAEVIAALAGLPDRPELDAVVARFFDDPAMAKRGWPLSWLLRNPAQWSGRSTTRGGHAPPRKAHEYEAREMSFDELMREREAALGGGTHG